MIVPGSVNPLLMAAGGDPLDEYFKIVRGVRYRAPASPSFHRVMAAGANRKKGAISLWLKPTKIAVASVSNNGNMHLFMGDNSTNLAGSGLTAYSRGVLVGDDSTGLNRLQWHSSGSAGEAFTSNAFYRDPAAHAHLYVRWDSTVPMLEAYWNGAEISYASRTLPTLNADTIIGIAAGLLKLGMFTSGDPRYFDGVFSDVRVFLGQTPAIAALGRFHPVTGQWRPTGFAGTYGAYDSYLDFSDNSAATAAAIGADRSGNGNNWTPTNISVTAGVTDDSVLDTPTNTYPSLNLLSGSSGAYNTISNGGLTLSNPSVSGTSGSAVSTMGVASGDSWYFEVMATGVPAGVSNPGVFIGVVPLDNPYVGAIGGNAPQSVGGYAYRSYNGNKVSPGGEVAYGATYAAGDLIGVLYVNGSLTFYKNNISQGVAFTGMTGTKFAAVGSVFQDGTLDFNFGQRVFTYPGTAGAIKPICTKNIPIPINPAVANPSSAFVAVTDTGANVQTTLAAARPGWVNYIEIFKRMDAAEGWRWRFSDDLGFALESNNTNAKIAFPALSGTSYLGEAIKVAAANGVATGRLVHTNGVADTVTDGLGNSRKMVMLRNEAGGNWFVYHPELTAGKLLYLNLTDAETTDATLGTVLSNSFVVAAALASDTYRWIAFAEVEGFLKLWKYIANGSADGPFHNDGLAARSNWWKDADTGTNNWHTHDTARDPYNQSDRNLIFNLSDAQSSQHGQDMNSNGIKVRTSASGSNLSGTKQIGVSFAQFPFRYANSR